MRTRACLYLLLISGYLSSAADAVDPAWDIRLLIDVTGSMQEFDPQNRRASALTLMQGLLPDQAQAGVWTYGRYVEMIVKWGRVDARWRATAASAIAKIHSNARLSHLEQALARARVGWQKPDAKTRRVLLLITGSGVEVSPDQAKDDASRERIVSQILPELQNAGARIHVVALGAARNDALLRRLAVATDGGFTAVDEGNDLRRAMFDACLQILAPMSGEFNGNEFEIDAEVQQLTLMLFRSGEGQPALIIPPDSPAIGAQKPRAARWLSGDGFDLVTLNRPEAGIWRIDASMDAGNRLLLQSDMALQVGAIPAQITPAEALDLFAELHHKGKKIRRNSYLRFVDFKLTHVDADGDAQVYTLEHSSVRKDKGRYLLQVEPGLAEGRHDFIFSASSNSFQRRRRFTTEVQWPVAVAIEAGSGAGLFDLRIQARQAYVKPDGLVAEVQIEAPDGSRETVILEHLADYLLGHIETRQNGMHRAHIKVSAQSHAGEILDLDLGALPFIGVLHEPVVATAKDEPEAVAESGMNRKLIGIVIVTVNLSILLLLLLGWWRMRRKHAVTENVLDEGEAREPL